MKKSDIKIGDHIVFNNGEVHISMGESWNNDTGWCDPEYWKETLEYIGVDEYSEWDIKEIWRPKHCHAYLKPFENKNNFKLVYESNQNQVNICSVVSQLKYDVDLIRNNLNNIANKLEKLYEQNK